MTTDIKEAAIDAAAKAIFTCSCLNETWDDAPGAVRQGCISTARAAIDAYEAAMNQQPEKAPMDELVLAKRRDYLFSPNLWMVARRINSRGDWQCIYGTRYHDRELLCFRPLPQPPEVKP